MLLDLNVLYCFEDIKIISILDNATVLISEIGILRLGKHLEGVDSGGCLNIKMLSDLYRISHYKDKMVLRQRETVSSL